MSESSLLVLARRWSAVALLLVFGDEYDRRAVQMLLAGELPADEAAAVRDALDSMWSGSDGAP